MLHDVARIFGFGSKLIGGLLWWSGVGCSVKHETYQAIVE